MKAMRFQEFRDVVGQKWIEKKTGKFPDQGWGSKTVDNVVYVWAKYETKLDEIARVEATSGKAVRFSIVHQSIIKHTGI